MANTPGTPASTGTTGSLSSTGNSSSSGLGTSGSVSGGGLGSSRTGGSVSDSAEGGEMGLAAGATLGSETITPLDTAGPATSGYSSGSTGGNDAAGAANRRAEARSRFNAALEEARAGLEALRADAAERGASYRAMATGSTSDWVGEVKSMSSEARKRAEGVANQGKTRASDGLSSLGKVLSETAGVIDERLGAKYGDYARSAARTMQESAARLEAKELGEISNDVRAFVKQSPGTAVGIAAVAGFFLARLFGSSKD